MKAVFLDRSTFPASISMPAPDGINWVEYPSTTEEQVIERCQGAQVIVANKALIKRMHMTQLPDLKLIAVTATGTNNVDLEACKEFGIAVVNATGYGTDSVAEHALMLMLAMTRNLKLYLQANETKHWSDSPFFHDPVAPINTLAGKTLTIVGRGTLGLDVAEKAEAMGMSILFAERLTSSETRTGYTPFKTALEQADFLSLHCPLTTETQFLMNKETFKLLKPTCVLINTGRGPLVNEEDLLEALNSGKLAGAALDVTQSEPPAKTDTIWQLAKLPNVIVTPHVAWAANESMQRLMDQILSKVSEFKNGQEILNLAQ